MARTEILHKYLTQVREDGEEAIQRLQAVFDGIDRRAALAVIGIAVIVIGAAAVLAGTALFGTDADTLPRFELHVDGEALSGIQGSYCWQDGQNSRCVDKVGPADLITTPGLDTAFIRDTSDLQIRTLNHSAPALYVYRVYNPQGDRVTGGTISTGSFQLDLPAGRYMLGVTGQWPTGDMTYFFRLDAQ